MFPADAASPPLSLIVPVYNVAPFLRRFLESLDTLDPGTAEIVVIDDGSTDECPRLLAEFARGRSHVRIVRQQNAGLSAARNTGLALARGRYVAFADSDDWFDRGYYERLLGLCLEHALDMAVGNAMYHFEGRRPDHPVFDDSPPAGVIRGADFLRARLRERSFLHMVWMHVYRRDLIESRGMRFVAPFIHEDVPWTTRMLLLAERLMYDPTPGYHYRKRVRRFDPAENDRRLLRVIESSLYNARDLDALAGGLGDDPELQRLLRWQLVDGALSIFHKLAKFHSAEARRECQRRLRREKLHALLWRNAIELRQKRRIARNYLMALASL
ncbi:MAG TPA: glycosyltransferase [Burkholderiales bacterium]|nr:glycosyltransferase [Burkholderiales bacterium]